MTSFARRAPASALLALLTAGVAVGAAPAPPTRLFLRALTSVFQHLEEGEFRSPRGLFFDRAHDELWVADSGNGYVAVYTPDGMPLHTQRPGGTVREPTRLVVGRDGRVLLLDADRTRIAVLDWRGRYLGPLELPGLPERPQFGALALDEAGNLYVGENSSGEVVVYRPDLKVRFRFGARGTGEGEFQAIADIAAESGRIVVVDHLATAVQIFDRHGSFERGFGRHELGIENFSLPEAVAIDSKGRLLVVDALRHEIKVFDANGKFLNRFGGSGRRPGEVSGPCDVAIDGRDRVYVAERSGGRVQIFEELELPVPPRERRKPARRERP